MLSDLFHFVNISINSQEKQSHNVLLTPKVNDDSSKKLYHLEMLPPDAALQTIFLEE